jgi:hypothetical protein
MNAETEDMWKYAIMAYLKVQLPYSLGRNEENHADPEQSFWGVKLTIHFQVVSRPRRRVSCIHPLSHFP